MKKEITKRFKDKRKEKEFLIKKHELLISAVFILATIVCISFEFPPYFFDIFGFITFSFLAYLGYLIKMGRKIPKVLGFILLLIAVLGILVDGSIVFKSYLL